MAKPSLKFMKGGRRLAATFMAGAVAMLVSSAASAGSFQVNPVNIQLPADRAASSLTIKNSDSTPVSVRVVTLKWTQEKGQDVYSETNDVVVSPPIFTIPAGATQLVRVGLRARTPGSAYRVIFEEIPKAQPGTTGIQVALRLNLPLYVLKDRGAADVRWRAFRSGKGDVVLEGRNEGTLHAQILNIDSVDARGNRANLSKEMGVVLPNSVRHWKIKANPEISAGASLLLNVRTETNEIQAKVLVESR